MHNTDSILAINAGSSSIKFTLYTKGEELYPFLAGKIEHIGSKDALFTIIQNKHENEVAIDASNFHTATLSLLDWMEKKHFFQQVTAIGHRLVHGINHSKAAIITDSLLKELTEIIDYIPDHLPAEIEIIRLLRQQHPALMQVACFDTAFHSSISIIAKTIAIPKMHFDQGVQHYGFHGISYSYLMGQLSKQNNRAAKGKVILAHLGSGASLAAVKDGKCMDTSMGFTPAGGVVMGTKSGDLDPGVSWYLMQQGMDAKAFNKKVNHQSGLLGISGLSGDMEVLLEQESEDEDAALAIAIFCYQIKKQIGAYLAVLSGLDTLVFSGGIGEHQAAIRSRICADFGFIGIELNEKKNQNHEWLISTDGSKVKVYVIPTNEELMIANCVSEILTKE